MPIEDISEHSKQLRSIQFVILASSFALLLSTAVTTSNLLEMTIDDIKALRTVDENKEQLGLDDYESWLLDEGRKVFEGLEDIPLVFPRGFELHTGNVGEPGSPTRQIFLMLEGHEWTILAREDWQDTPFPGNDWAHPSQAVSVSNPDLSTVSGWIRFWDDLSSRRVWIPQSLEKLVYTTGTNKSRRLQPAQHVPAQILAGELPTREEWETLRPIYFLSLFPTSDLHQDTTASTRGVECAFFSDSVITRTQGRDEFDQFEDKIVRLSVTVGEYFIPARCVGIDAGLHEAMSELLGVDILPTIFHRPFGRVQEASVRIGEDNLERLGGKLSEELLTQQDKKDAVKILGFEIPVDLIVRWVIPVMVLLQVYFVISLRNFCAILEQNDHLIDSAREIPWIGLHSGPISQIALWIAVVVIPFAVLFVASVDAWGEIVDTTLYAVLILFDTLYFAAASWTAASIIVLRSVVMRADERPTS